jgi:hypothetical protein
LVALWFLAGVAFTLTFIVVMLPWLRTVPGLGSLPALPWQFGACAVLTMAAVLGVCVWLARADLPVAQREVASNNVPGKTAVTSNGGVDSWAGIQKALGAGPNTTRSGAQSSAQPMSSAIVALQTRLSKGGGSADDWELLAKSYEFLGRPADASKVRAHQLPSLPANDSRSPTADAPRTGAAGSTSAVSGEVSLAASLKAKAAAGATLFVVAKSVDSPGAPVAVYRTTVDRWPLKFQLSDSQSMLPGRNLSSAGRVTVEARISQSGQALPAPGDLEGATGVIDPADHRPLQILIDKVVK